MPDCPWAKRLGDLEDERAGLSPPTSTATEVNAAHYTWVRVVNALLANAELAGVDADTDRLLFAPLRAAEQTAESRGHSKPAPAPAPANPPSAVPPR